MQSMPVAAWTLGESAVVTGIVHGESEVYGQDHRA